MIYDCFSFFNELDILDIRLHTLNDVVDKFVLVEAPWIHRTGKSKPLYFAENKDRFAPFLDKIIHIVVTDADLPPIPPTADDVEMGWIRENTQRNGIAKGLKDANPEDILIIADLDEIPSPDAIKSASSTPNGVINVDIRNFSYFLNYANVSAPIHFGGPQILTYATFLSIDTYKKIPKEITHPECANTPPTATLIRFAPRAKHIKGGWHFSSQGGFEAIQHKIDCIAEGHLIDEIYHLNIAALTQRIKAGKGIDNNFVHLCPEPINHDFPQFIVDNQVRFANQLLPATEKSWRLSRFSRFYHLARRVTHDICLTTLIHIIPTSLHPLCSRIRKKLSF